MPWAANRAIATRSMPKPAQAVCAGSPSAWRMPKLSAKCVRCVFALEIAVREIAAFLMENEMQVYLVVFGAGAQEGKIKAVAVVIDDVMIPAAEDQKG